EGCERTLAGLLGPKGPMRIIAFHNPDFDRRGVLDARHAIVEHVGGDEETVVIGGLFAHRLSPAHPYPPPEPPFDGETIECLAAIMRHPDLVDTDDPGLLVHGHFDDLGRIAVPHGAANRRAAIFLAAVRLRDRGIVARHRYRARLAQRLCHDFI